MNVFDIIGPIMIGPSSSHTAGAVRLGRVAWKMLEEPPARIDITLSGSFAETGRGHGTDKALVAGCMGMHSYDPGIRCALETAAERGIACTFRNENIPGSHPNTARIHLVGADGKETTVEGASVGGGNIVVDNVNGMDVEFTGQNNMILVRHMDKPGAIAAVTNFMAYAEVNICNFRLSRKKKGGEALMMVEVDGEIPENLPEQIKLLPHILSVIVIHAI